MELNNRKQLKERFELMKSYFQEESLEFIFEEHSYVDKIIFFGSFMKGRNTDKSDIDLIVVPNDSFIEEMDIEDKIGCLHGLYEDLSSGLATEIPIDVKLQDFYVDGNQFGIAYRTGMLTCTDYEFGREQIGFCAIIDRDQTVEFQTL